MANKHKGEVALQYDGATYSMVFDFNAMADLEDLLGGGVNAIELLQRQSRGGSALSAKEMRAIFFCGLRQNHEDMTLDLAGKILSANAAKFIETMTAAFPDAGEEVGNAPPNRKARKALRAS